MLLKQNLWKISFYLGILSIIIFFIKDLHFELENNPVLNVFRSDEFLLRLNAEATVTIEAGTIIGKVTKSYRAFLGIPYAEPPLGPLRWREPIMLKKFATPIIYATRYGKSCIQHLFGVSLARIFLIGEGEEECEDCLNINVHTPRLSVLDQYPNGLPVIIFIYGGKFSSGSNSQEAYNPSRLFKRDEKIVFVAPNYRVGPLGFLASKELVEYARQQGLDETVVGNYGIFDILLAIEWTHRNIRAFGGDPNNITLQGQSAGAMACLFVYRALLKAQKFYIRRLILNSLSDPNYVMRTLDDGITQQSFDTIAFEAGCSKYKNGPLNEYIDCIKRLPASELKKIVFKRHLDCIWSSFQDGNLFHPSDIKDYSSNIPEEYKAKVFITIMKDDATLFVYKADAMDYQSSVRALSILYHDYKVSSRILDHYPPHHFDNHFHALSQAVTDHVFRCPSIELFYSLQQQGHEVYYLELAFELSILSMLCKWTIRNNIGAFHGIDILIFFSARNFLLTAKERLNAQLFQRRILSFVTGGSPALWEGEKLVPANAPRCKFWQDNRVPFPRKSYAHFCCTDPFEESDDKSK